MSAPAAAARALWGAPSASKSRESGAERTLDVLGGEPAASVRFTRHFAARCADLPQHNPCLAVWHVLYLCLGRR